jgi:transcriptional regulator with XRE-family HTH domain
VITLDKKRYANAIAKRIKALALDRQISVSRVLQQCGLPVNFINNMSGERGSIPAANSLIPIADYFDVSVDYLLGRETRKDPVKSEILETVEHELKGLGVADADISPEDRRVLIDCIMTHIETQFALYKQLKNQ